MSSIEGTLAGAPLTDPGRNAIVDTKVKIGNNFPKLTPFRRSLPKMLNFDDLKVVFPKSYANEIISLQLRSYVGDEGFGGFL